jgi:hypothetical protein
MTERSRITCCGLAWVLLGSSPACTTSLDEGESILSSCQVGEPGCTEDPESVEFVFRMKYFPIQDGMVSNDVHRSQLELAIDGQRVNAFSSDLNTGLLFQVSPGEHTYTLHPVEVDEIEPPEGDLAPAVATLPDLTAAENDQLILAFGEEDALDVRLIDLAPPPEGIADDSIHYTIYNLDPGAPLDILNWPDADVCDPEGWPGESVPLVTGLTFAESAVVSGKVVKHLFMTDGDAGQRLRGDFDCGSSYNLVFWLPPFDWSLNQFNYFYNAHGGFLDQGACTLYPPLANECH